MATVSRFARFFIVLTTVSAAVMELVDTSIVNVALSQMAGSLGVTIEDVSWVITSYAIANVIIIPMTGFLGAYFGRKNYYVFSMVLFTAASWMCGSSTGLWELVFWRFIQGIGGGALLSTSQSILFDAFEPKDRPMASGLFGMGVVLGPTLGPTIGGYILDNAEWPLIFTVNIPIGIVATFLSVLFVDKKPGEGEQKKGFVIDYTGIALLAVGIGSLQYVLERGEAEDWFASEAIRVLTVTALIGVVGFIWRQLTTPHPVVNLRVMGNRTLALTTVFTFVIGIGLFTSVFVYPILAQRVLGLTPLETGLSLLPATAIGVVMMPLIGRRMASGASPIPFVIIGFLIFIAFGWMAAGVNAQAGKWDFFWPLALRAVGISMVQLPLINQAVAGLKPHEYPSGIALNNMIRQLGGAFGIAISNNYMARQFAQHKADLVSNAVPGNPAFDERLNIMVQGMMSRTGAALSDATAMAYKQLNFAIERQAYLLTYLDTFRLVSLFFVVVFPLIFFIKIKKQGPPTEAAKAAMEDAH
ncbi:MAG: DHA2 family efflux MFS transporter permease subunit [Saprospiraceae bacterium]|nr:DHA2 family efflux MFS transporter permease subunit [Saprospiraceae bacterium]